MAANLLFITTLHPSIKNPKEGLVGPQGIHGLDKFIGPDVMYVHLHITEERTGKNKV